MPNNTIHLCLCGVLSAGACFISELQGVRYTIAVCWILLESTGNKDKIGILRVGEG